MRSTEAAFSLTNTLKGGSNGPRSSYNVDQTITSQRDNQSYGGTGTAGFYLSARNYTGNAQKSVNKIVDPEGIDALNAIEEFENRNAKKPNRYPKASFEKHLNLDDTMRKKIKERNELT